MSSRILATRWGLTYLQVAVAVFVGAAIVCFWSHALRVDCDRARAACTARDEKPLSTEVHAFAASTGMHAREQLRTYNGTSLTSPTWVEIADGDRVVTLTRVSEGSYRDDKGAMVQQLNAFFAGTSPEVHAAYGDRHSAWPQALLFAVILLLIGPKITLRARYEAEKKELVVERRLLGILLERERIAASPFRSATADTWAIVDPPRATKAKAFSDRTWGVGLVDESGTMTPVPLWSSSKRLATNLAATLTNIFAQVSP